MSRTPHCTYHCGACGRHFHSLQAFDMHRVGDFQSNDPETGRRCESPYDVLDKKGEMRMCPLTETGVCDVYEHQEGQTIWVVASTLRSAREKWEKAWSCAGCGASDGRYDNGDACERCVMCSFAESG